MNPNFPNPEPIPSSPMALLSIRRKRDRDERKKEIEKRGMYLAPRSAVSSSIVAISLQTSLPSASSSNGQGVFSNKSSPSPRSIRQWGIESSGRRFASRCHHRQSPSTIVITIISHHSFAIAFLWLKRSHKRKKPTPFSSSLGIVLETV